MKFLTKPITVLLFFLLFTPKAHTDEAPSQFNIGGGKNVGDIITVDATIWGSACNGIRDVPVYEIALTTWGGSAEGYATEFSGGQMNAILR